MPKTTPSQPEQGCDAWPGRQDGVGVGLRHHERAVLLHEPPAFGAAVSRFLNVGARLMSRDVNQFSHNHRGATSIVETQRHGVVQNARLDIARAMRCGAGVVLGDAQQLNRAFHRGVAKQRASKRATTGVTRCGRCQRRITQRGKSDDLARTDRERTHIERSTPSAKRRHQAASSRNHNGLHGLRNLSFGKPGISRRFALELNMRSAFMSGRKRFGRAIFRWL